MSAKYPDKEGYVDKDGSVHYGGEAAHAEEWEERALLGFLACTTKEQKAAAGRTAMLFSRTNFMLSVPMLNSSGPAAAAQAVFGYNVILCLV